ncbi:hypothetical protein A2U01_0009020 [Trifolium medium]|uniref:Uncharacterized protein n=1 Tax=Trifolium medium TaxID=97028 RepID=A0A392MMF3_9FABA|nr:hypothetical protein [Trifolium medium]
MPHFDDYIYMYRDLADADVISDQSAYGVITNFMASKISSLITRVDDKLCRLIVPDLSDDDIPAIAIARWFLGINYQIHYCVAQIAKNIIQITPLCVRGFAPFILPCTFLSLPPLSLIDFMLLNIDLFIPFIRSLYHECLVRGVATCKYISLFLRFSP